MTTPHPYTHTRVEKLTTERIKVCKLGLIILRFTQRETGEGVDEKTCVEDRRSQRPKTTDRRQEDCERHFAVTFHS